MIRKEKRPADTAKGWRPIALLETPEKLLEKIVAKKLQKVPNLTGPHAVGGVMGENFIDHLVMALTEATGTVAKNKRKKRWTLLDVVSAFNATRLHRVLERLYRYEKARSWSEVIRRMMSPRKLAIIWNDIDQHYSTHKSGTPQ